MNQELIKQVKVLGMDGTLSSLIEYLEDIEEPESYVLLLLQDLRTTYANYLNRYAHKSCSNLSMSPLGKIKFENNNPGSSKTG